MSCASTVGPQVIAVGAANGLASEGMTDAKDAPTLGIQIGNVRTCGGSIVGLKLTLVQRTLMNARRLILPYPTSSTNPSIVTTAVRKGTSDTNARTNDLSRVAGEYNCKDRRVHRLFLLDRDRWVVVALAAWTTPIAAALMVRLGCLCSLAFHLGKE